MSGLRQQCSLRCLAPGCCAAPGEGMRGLNKPLCAAMLLSVSRSDAIRNDPMPCSPQSECSRWGYCQVHSSATTPLAAEGLVGGDTCPLCKLLWPLASGWSSHAPYCLSDASLMPLHCWLLQGMLVNAHPGKLLGRLLGDWVSHPPHCLHGAFSPFANALLAAAGPPGGDTCPPGPQAGAGGQLPGG